MSIKVVILESAEHDLTQALHRQELLSSEP